MQRTLCPPERLEAAEVFQNSTPPSLLPSLFHKFAFKIKVRFAEILL